MKMIIVPDLNDWFGDRRVEVAYRTLSASAGCMNIDAIVVLKRMPSGLCTMPTIHRKPKSMYTTLLHVPAAGRANKLLLLDVLCTSICITALRPTSPIDRIAQEHCRSRHPPASCGHSAQHKRTCSATSTSKLDAPALEATDQIRHLVAHAIYICCSNIQATTSVSLSSSTRKQQTVMAGQLHHHLTSQGFHFQCCQVICPSGSHIHYS